MPGKHKRIHIFMLTIVCFILARDLMATGILYVRPRGSSTSYQKVWIKSLNIDVTIQDQVAETHVDQIFLNELNQSAEAIYIFPLPENAMVTELVYWLNGERFVAEIRERQEALNDYNAKLREWLDPALLEYLGDNLFRLSIVPVNALSEFRTEITYVELLNYDFGISKYRFLMNTLELSSQPLETVHLYLDANSQNPYKYFTSPSHTNSQETQIIRITDHHYTLEFGDENFYPDKDLRVQFESIREDVEFSFLSYKPAPADSFGTDGFFTMWITPPDSFAQEQIIPKDIIFTADLSSSMDGLRLTQVKQSLSYFLDELTETDRFNIITFATHVVQFKEDMVSADIPNISAAHQFVDQMYALGMTNISAALDSSLQQTYRETASKNIIFLTDGEPTFGITLPDSIISHARSNNQHDVRIFSFGVGEDVNRSLLTRLSMENFGYAYYIASDDSIALIVKNHIKRISKPLMNNLQIDYGGLATWDRYPKLKQDLYWGMQSMEMGLYNGSGDFSISLSGWYAGDSVSFTKMIDISDSLGGYRFVPRLWARAKIDHLLDLIEIYGESDELVNQIIELSLRFQILTPYTALYVDPTLIEEKPREQLAGKFELFANYPNPFNPETTIRYRLPADQVMFRVVIKIYDVLGRLIVTLKDEQAAPGLYSLTWDGRDSDGNPAPSGIYFCRLSAGSYSASQKMLLVR